LEVEYPSYPYRQKAQILLFKSKWDTLSILNIENEKYYVSKNRGAAPLKADFDRLQVDKLVLFLTQLQVDFERSSLLGKLI
jgi:hypothetical protein